MTINPNKIGLGINKHFKGQAQTVSNPSFGSGGGGGGSAPIPLEVASPVVVRVEYTLQFIFADTVIPVDTYMDASAQLWSKFDYGATHDDSPCGYGMTMRCKAQLFGGRPAQGSNLRNAVTFFAPASWNDLTNPHELKARLVYAVDGVGLDYDIQRADWWSDSIGYSGATLTDTGANISVRGLFLERLSNTQGFNVFSMRVAQSVTGYSYTASITYQNIVVARRVFDSTDNTWVASPITW